MEWKEEWLEPTIPDGWSACLVCDLLIPESNWICVYCQAEGEFRSIHAPMMPPFETHGAIEAPCTVHLAGKNATRRHVFRPVRASSIRWSAAGESPIWINFIQHDRWGYERQQSANLTYRHIGFWR